MVNTIHTNYNGKLDGSDLTIQDQVGSGDGIGWNRNLSILPRAAPGLSWRNSERRVGHGSPDPANVRDSGKPLS